jgi:dihydroxyacetone kinase
MAQFINAKENLVTEAIDGLLAACGGSLARLDGFPHIKVILRSDWNRDRVAVVSGGGSGHEPAHAGFVGRGMLTAAICGEVFASPSVDAVLAGILAVAGDAGVLLIVTNYTGDRLNFGLAAEKARALGVKVEMVVIADDVALPDLPQPRGVAGTLFVHKVAGALAEQGASLMQVAEAARRTAAAAVSIGKSLSTCQVPGSEREDRIPEGQAELGLGIHGEPGVDLVPFTSAAASVGQLLDLLAPHAGAGPKAVLVNNLGGCTPLEMAVIAGEVTRRAAAHGISHVIGPAALMTSLDMRGFSLSLLPLDAATEGLLSAPAQPSAWPAMQRIAAPRVLPVPDGLQPPRMAPSANPAAHALLTAATAIIAGLERDLNALDARTGDGDTGSTLATAARTLAGSLDDLPLGDTGAMLRGIGNVLSTAMGGSSGVLLAIFFSAAGDAAAQGAGWHQALKAGLDRIMQVGGAGPGDRTMIDALAPALDALAEGLSGAARAARGGADATAAMTRARAGRSAYVNAANLTGVNDPGAEAVARLFEGLAAR